MLSIPYSNGGGGTLNLRLSGDYTGQTCYLVPNGEGGTVVSLDGVACYRHGTLILTDRGEAAVETLRIGDLVVTRSGAGRPIRWIGQRRYAGAAAQDPEVRPVRIAAGALANGASIRQIEAADEVAYCHLELDTHDVIHAEGALSETFVDDDGSRRNFDNVAEYHALYPAAPAAPPRYCAPRLEDGEALDAVRQRLAPRAHPGAATGPPARRLRGSLDHVGRDRIAGWACDEADPGAPVAVRILDNGAVLGLVTADQYRPDLAQAGIGTGRHGFAFIVPGGLSPETRHVIQAQPVADGQDLAGSPAVREPEADAPAASAISPMHGYLDTATRELIGGWAWDPLRPDERVPLQIVANGAVIGAVLANRLRPDLAKAGVGDGRHGFQLAIPGGLPPDRRHVIHVRHAADGAELQHSPAVIEAADRFDAWPHYGSVEDVLRRQAGCFDAVYLHRPATVAKYHGLARHHCPGARILSGAAERRPVHRTGLVGGHGPS